MKKRLIKKIYLLEHYNFYGVKRLRRFLEENKRDGGKSIRETQHFKNTFKG